MEYREIVAVTGIGGLFQLMATKSDGAIVRNLADKTTKFISARLHNVTPLESIEVFTQSDNVRLHEVFQKMKDETAVAMPDAGKADSNTLKTYFKTVFPDIDEERVYVSDMKKMVKWFEILKDNDLLDFEALNKTEEVAEEATEPVAEEKPKKAKKEAAVETTETTEEVKPKKAAKKPARPLGGKAAEPTAEGEEKPAKKTAKKKKEGE